MIQTTAWDVSSTNLVLTRYHEFLCIGRRSRGAFTQAEIRIIYWNEYVTERMRLDFAELPARYFIFKDSDLHGISSIADKPAFVTAEVARVEDVVSSDCNAIDEDPEKIVKPDVILKSDDKNWDLEGIVTVEKTKGRKVRETLHATREKRCPVKCRGPC